MFWFYSGEETEWFTKPHLCLRFLLQHDDLANRNDLVFQKKTPIDGAIRQSMVHPVSKLANLSQPRHANVSLQFGLAAVETKSQAAGVNSAGAVLNARSTAPVAKSSVSRSSVFRNSSPRAADLFNPNSASRPMQPQTQVEKGLPTFTRWMENYRQAAPAINTTMAVIGTTGNGLVRLDAATGAFTRSLGARSFYGVVNKAMDGYIAESPRLTRFLKDHPILSGIPLVIGMSALCSFAGDGLKTVLTAVYDFAIRPPVAYLINTFGVDMTAYKSACATSEWLKKTVDLLENPRFRNVVGLGSLAIVGLMAFSRYNRNHLQANQ